MNIWKESKKMNKEKEIVTENRKQIEKKRKRKDIRNTEKDRGQPKK